MNKRWRNIGLYVLIVVVVIFVGSAFFDKPSPTKASRTLRYSDFIEAVQEKQISRVLISPDKGTAQIVESDGNRALVNLAPDQQLLQLLTDNDVDIAVQPTTQANPLQQAATSLIFPILLLGGLFFLFRRAGSGGGGGNPAMNFGKSKARLQMEPETKVTFGDVAGIEGAKLELTEVVDFLKNPDRFTAVGAKIPKGVLLVGPPGTGKTLLAKAVAGEASVPFFSISGSEFVEMFVGVGASRVRDLFEQAKKNAPCIIFIDEIDAVGRSRGAGLGGGNDEREQTLNQLLVEMDGFETNEGVIIIAATNRPDVLDPALLRPGRFDRQVVVSNPDIIGREKILKVHVKKIKMAPDVNLRTVARGTPGFSGADLANLVNEAALLAARKNKRIVTLSEFEEAKDKVMMGAERRSMVMTEEEKKLTAYHEGGHALVSFNMPSYDPIHKATIIPRGRALGMVMNLPERDKHGYSIKYLKARLAVCFGGRVAEELIFGKDNISTGAGGGSGSDINQATQLARAMVTKYGMSEEMGPVEYGENQEEVFLGRSVTQTQSVSEAVAQKIDKEIRKLVDEGYNQAKKILTDKIDDLHKLAKALLIYETLSGDEIRDLILKDIKPTKSFKEDDQDDGKSSSALGSLGLKPKPAI